MQNSRSRIFLTLCLACVCLLAAYFLFVARRPVAASKTAKTDSISQELEAYDSIPAADRSPRFIFFRYTGVDDNYGKLAVVDLDHRDQPRFVEGFSCEAVHFTGGHGICLTADRGVFTTYAAQLFDTKLKPLFKIPLNGGPSRSRVSRDGAIAACTVFISGHGYASVDFSTQTLLFETATGNVLASLEDISVTREGQPFHAADFNFWGVTFTPDSRHFYCTLSSNRTHYLVEGDIAGRTATVVHDNAECPSVSPDGTRVAYKKRFIIEDRLVWQLHVLDLATMQETPLAEKRSVDDQIEWLDNSHVLYAVSDNPDGSSATTDVWKADAAGKTAPEMFIAKAYSPAVVR
jgi:hypothetical protein